MTGADHLAQIIKGGFVHLAKCSGGMFTRKGRILIPFLGSCFSLLCIMMGNAALK